MNAAGRNEAGHWGRRQTVSLPVETHPPYLILAAALGNKAAAAFQLGLRVSFQPEWNLAPPL